MDEVVSLSEARAKFYQVMNRVIYKRERIIISKWGRKVAVILPFEELDRFMDEELLDAKPVPAEEESEFVKFML